VLEEIALDAYALPYDHQVYKCFPGEGYKFYDVVLNESVIFLDVRGLDNLSENPATWSDDALLHVTTLDHVVRNPTGPRRKGQRRRRKSGVPQRNANFVKGLLLTAKKGDLIVVPPPGWRREVLIGEIADEPGTPIRVEAKDGEETFTYLGRKVRWRTSVEKRFMRQTLLEKLHNPQAFFPVGIDQHEDVYALAYENYVWRDNFVATFRTSKERFTSADNLVASVWFNGLTAARNAAENNTLLTTSSFVDAALLPTAPDTENELELNINSPGTILVRSASAFALAAMALLPLNATEAQAVADGNTRITLHAVGGVDPGCQLQVEAAVADYVRSLGPDLLLEACEFGDKARNGATLRSRVQLKRTPKGHK
jgi:hypothetical protein